MTSGPVPPPVGRPTPGSSVDLAIDDPWKSTSRPAEVGNREAVSRGASWTLVSIGVATPLTLAVNVFVSRALGPVGYGEVAVLILALSVATQLANLGYSTAAIRWGTAAWARGDEAEFEHVLAKSMWFHCFFQGPILCIVAVVVAVVADIDQPGLILPIVVGVASPCITSSAALLLTMKSRTDRMAQVSILSTAVVQLTTLSAALLSRRADVTWACTLAAAGLGGLLLFGALHGDERRLAFRIRVPLRNPPGFVSFAWLTGATGLINTMVASRSEVFVLAALTSGADTGRFALAFGMASLLTGPVNSLIGPLVPAAVRIVATDPAGADQAYLRTLRVSAMFSGLTLALVVPPIAILMPAIYGTEFGETRLMFVPLAAAACIVSVCNPALVFLNATGAASTMLRRSIFALGVNVVFALTLIPILGVWGAVAANGITSLANSLPVVAAHRRGSTISRRQICRELQPLGLALVMGVGLLMLILEFGPSGLGWVLMVLVAAVLIWLLGLRAMGARLDEDSRSAVKAGLPGRRIPVFGGLSRFAVGALT